MKWPQFLQFTPDERKAVLALVVFTAGGGLVLEVSRRHPEWTPGLRRLTPAAVDTSAAGDTPIDEGRTPGLRVSTVLAPPSARPPDDLAPPPPPPAAAPPADVPPAAPRSEPRRREAAPPAMVDPNQADQAALEALPGIGPAMARRILEDRAARGPFRRPEDLLRVKGIGPATLNRLRPFLRVSG